MLPNGATRQVAPPRCGQAAVGRAQRTSRLTERIDVPRRRHTIQSRTEEMSWPNASAHLASALITSGGCLKPAHYQFTLAASWAIESLSEIPLNATP